MSRYKSEEELQIAETRYEYLVKKTSDAMTEEMAKPHGTWDVERVEEHYDEIRQLKTDISVYLAKSQHHGGAI